MEEITLIRSLFTAAGLPADDAEVEKAVSFHPLLQGLTAMLAATASQLDHGFENVTGTEVAPQT